MTGKADSATIVRIWHGWTRPEQAEAYERLLKEEVFAAIAAKGVTGYRGIQLCRRESAGRALGRWNAEASRATLSGRARTSERPIHDPPKGSAQLPMTTTWRCFMDDDLADMTREELLEEAKKLRRGIRSHRDSSRHELCWHHPSLWGLLPEKTDPVPVVPEWPEFMRGCIHYRQSLDEQAPEAPRTDRAYDVGDR